MILSCTYEELRALAIGADLLLSGDEGHSGSPVAAPAEARAQVELLQPRLTGGLSIETLAEQRSVRSAVALICERLHSQMDTKVLEYHPAHEEAVSFYFDYAHALAVLNRLDEMGTEMNALIELMTGQPATAESAAAINFAD
ncbi:MAG TPA: hypothetical protein VFU47_14055 [Armatimonadota bacterium]|nr:hypothetical protein [Armatimonadota bacterium]